MKLIGGGGPSESRAERAQWVQRYRASGLGLKRFAKLHGLGPAQLHYWTYRSPAGAGEDRKIIPIFREVAVPTDWNPTPRWTAEIGLPDGLAVRLSPGAEVAWVRELVESLRRPCSR